ncbi:MAG: helix-turn-helix domain-containing protein [Candidatus Micrarchaeota archaeon]|nr:helix-turn-helix domain-containing protein [Candidatus Micrarchaeota archaeon]
MKKAEQYKPIGDAPGENETEKSGAQSIAELKHEVLTPLQQDMEKLRDPFVLAAIMNTAANERETTNRLLKTIIERLDTKFSELENRIALLESAPSQPANGAPTSGEVFLPEVDENILGFVNRRGHATAEEVRAKFGYRGKNAASARLNRMYERGLITKKQVGRTVLFCAKK